MPETNKQQSPLAVACVANADESPNIIVYRKVTQLFSFWFYILASFAVNRGNFLFLSEPKLRPWKLIDRAVYY